MEIASVVEQTADAREARPLDHRMPDLWQFKTPMGEKRRSMEYALGITGHRC